MQKHVQLAETNVGACGKVHRDGDDDARRDARRDGHDSDRDHRDEHDADEHDADEHDAHDDRYEHAAAPDIHHHHDVHVASAAVPLEP